MADRDVRAQVTRLETQLGVLEALADPAARATVLAAVQGLVQLYGEGLARMVDHVAASGDAALAAAFANDELVSHLLLLHGLHPDGAEVRVRRALDGLHATLQPQGAWAELLAVDGDVARVRLGVGGGGGGGGHGGASATAALRQAVEEAVRNAAPELERVDMEEVGPAPVLVPLTLARRDGARAASR